MVHYVKGFEYSVPKAAAQLQMTEEEFPVRNAVKDLMDHLVRDSYDRLEYGPRVGGDNQKYYFIFVIDEDVDLEALMARPVTRREPDLSWAISVLEGPHIYTLL